MDAGHRSHNELRPLHVEAEDADAQSSIGASRADQGNALLEPHTVDEALLEMLRVPVPAEAPEENRAPDPIDRASGTSSETRPRAKGHGGSAAAQHHKSEWAAASAWQSACADEETEAAAPEGSGRRSGLLREPG